MATRQAVLGMERASFFYGSARVFGGVTFLLDGARTALVGENGTGKSTLVEGIAVAAGFPPEGGSLGFGARTRDEVAALADGLRLDRSHRRPRTGFFLRAESFFNVATEIDRLDAEAREYRIPMGFPDAWIYELSDRGAERVEYDATDHVRLTRSFLDDRERFLRQLFS
jgi:predicted ATPase